MNPVGAVVIVIAIVLIIVGISGTQSTLLTALKGATPAKVAAGGVTINSGGSSTTIPSNGAPTGTTNSAGQPLYGYNPGGAL